MKEARILIAGGYGAVGREVVKLLTKKSGLHPIIGGRDEIKAKSFAAQENCEWGVIDLDNRESITAGLRGIDIVVNCFLPSDDYHTDLAESAIELGIHYLDVSAFIGYSERIMKLNKAAKEKEVTTITALGAYPGITGLLILDAKNHFSEISSADAYFAMGGKLDGMTPLSLIGVDYMMSVPPLTWNKDKWEKAKMSGTKEFMGEPFNKMIGFFPGMITFDLHALPDAMNLNRLSCWSGVENTLQGLIFFLGNKLGLGKNEKRAKRFLKLLLFLGKGKKNHSDTVLKIVVEGEKDGVLKKRIIELHETEDYLTALIPVLACEQLVHSHVKKRGAFTGPQIIDTTKLIKSLKESNISFKENWE
jgi:saccharopine dehydrogenase-like NADP-dependent oxidoreductase